MLLLIDTDFDSDDFEIDIDIAVDSDVADSGKFYGSPGKVNGCPVIFQYLPAICYAILLVESIYSDRAVPAAGSDFTSEKGLEEKA